MNKLIRLNGGAIYYIINSIKGVGVVKICLQTDIDLLCAVSVDVSEKKKKIILTFLQFIKQTG